MAVAWHVDDVGVSHNGMAKIDKFGAYLKHVYKKAELKVTKHKGVLHDYLGIDLDYSS